MGCEKIKKKKKNSHTHEVKYVQGVLEKCQIFIWVANACHIVYFSDAETGERRI